MTSGSGSRALTELTVTMAPAPRSMRWGSAARGVRTAARKLILNAESQSSSVTDRNPPVRGRTAPTLLTRMSRLPYAATAASTSRSGPSGLVRSTDTGRTVVRAARSDSSVVAPRAPATTRTPSPARARVIANPMPLLAPVTTAILPARCRSMTYLDPVVSGRSERVLLQPGQGAVGNLAPTVVDGQRVRPVGELHDVGDGLRVPVLLESGPGDRLRYGVVPAAHDQQQWPTQLVGGVDLGRRLWVEVGGGSFEEGLAGRWDGPSFVQLVGLLLGDRVAEPVPELHGGQRDGPVPVGRVLEDRKGDPQRGQRQREYPLDLGGVNRHGSR